MPALKVATGIILGVVNITPMGRLVSTAVMGIADTASHGKASAFANNGHQVNGTLSMLPGGMLAQQVANDATHGKSGNTISKYVPDPKKMAIHAAVKIGETIVTHPKSTLDVGRDLIHEDKISVKTIGSNYRGSVTTTIPRNVVPIPNDIVSTKPSIITAILPQYSIEKSISSTLPTSPDVFTTKKSIASVIAPMFLTQKAIIDPIASQINPTKPSDMVVLPIQQSVTTIPTSTISPGVTPTSTIPTSTFSTPVIPTSSIQPINSTLGLSTPIPDQIATPESIPLIGGVLGAICLACFMLF